MVDVPLQGEDLLDVILLLLLVLLNLEGCTADLFLSVLHLRVKLLVFIRDCFYSVLESLNLEAGVSVVCKNVLLFNFESPACLLSSSLLIN